MQQGREQRRQEQRSKKKIIPVQSSEEESESAPSSPAESPQPQAMSLSARYRLSQAAADPSPGQLEVPPPAQQQPALGQKLKNSYSFRERKSPQNLSLRSQPQQQQRRKHSVESQHSFRSVTSTPGSGRRGSVTEGPPAGPRVVLGRETSPTPSREARDPGHVSQLPDPHVSRLPSEIMDKFSGQTREDLIEMLVRLQGTVECQGKKVADLEDYIDTLLIRVMDTAPVLLEN